MERFHIYQKQARGKPKITIADLIPVGRENAIKRRVLLFLCFENELVDKPLDVNDEKEMEKADRAMRKLIEKARADYVILNLSNGKGYYRVSKDDLQDLQRYIRQEEKRAKSAFKNIKRARALYEDYKHGRVDGGD